MDEHVSPARVFQAIKRIEAKLGVIVELLEARANGKVEKIPGYSEPSSRVEGPELPAETGDEQITQLGSEDPSPAQGQG